MPGRWMINDHRSISQKLSDVSSTQMHPEGMIVRGQYTGFASGSNNYGSGEFMYLKGVASTIVGALVTFDPLNHTTTLAPNTANLNNPVAVAMGVAVASTWGWYQVGGVALVKKTGVPVSPGVAVFLSGTAGRIKSTTATGKQIVNARSVNAATIAAATSSVPVLINRPHAQGQII